MDQIDPGLLAEILPDIKSTIATTVIGFTIATALYGAAVLQVYLYYRNYQEDIVWYKILVGLLWIFDTLTTILVGHSLFSFAVMNLGNILADTLIPWSFSLENEIMDIITLLAQGFYAYQIFRVTGSVLLPSIVALLAVIAFGIDIWVTIQLFQSTSTADLSTSGILVTASVVQGICALCDIIITATLVFYLRSKKTGVRATGNLIDKLILYAITRGMFTAVCQLIFMSLNVGFPDKTYWIPFHLILSKRQVVIAGSLLISTSVYVNSVFSTLNVRKSMNKPTFQSDADFSMRVLSPQSYNERTLGSTEEKYTGTSGTLNIGGSKTILPVTVTTTKDTS